MGNAIDRYVDNANRNTMDLHWAKFAEIHHIQLKDKLPSTKKKIRARLRRALQDKGLVRPVGRL